MSTFSVQVDLPSSTCKQTKESLHDQSSSIFLLLSWQQIMDSRETTSAAGLATSVSNDRLHFEGGKHCMHI